LEYRIYQADFISTASSYFDECSALFSDHELTDQYDGVIMNPPYFKVNKNSHHAQLMRRIVHGQPNAYAFFLALAARLLREGGEMVAITPRSFCSGLYFRGFREWFFENVSLDHIHSFESRTDTFCEAGVLQESVITKTHRLGLPSENVSISHSWGREIDADDLPLELPHDAVVCDKHLDRVVKVPVSTEDVRIMDIVESLPHSFTECGLRVSTGPVVMFRCTDHLEYEYTEDNNDIPLLLPHNVKPFTTMWPVQKKSKPIAIRDCLETRSLLLPANNYILLKRFSAKEEKRRLTAGCFLTSQYGTNRIGLENHLNYIYHSQRQLSQEETLGIAAFFNSTLLDRYFRIISGNTQVNATEIRNLRFPSLEEISRIGRELIQMTTIESEEVDRILLDILGVEEYAGLTV
jgi:adenine-specific DNA-methyltransferase